MVAACALKHFMVKSCTDKNRAAENEPVCCQQCVVVCRLYDTGNGQLGGIRPVDIIPGFILPGITLVLDAQLVSGRKNRFNQRTAIRLEALIIFIRSGVIIAISPQGQNRIPCQQRLYFLVRNAGLCGSSSSGKAQTVVFSVPFEALCIKTLGMSPLSLTQISASIWLDWILSDVTV